MCILWGDEAENKAEASNSTASGEPSTYPASCAMYILFRGRKKKKGNRGIHIVEVNRWIKLPFVNSNVICIINYSSLALGHILSMCFKLFNNNIFFRK